MCACLVPDWNFPDTLRFEYYLTDHLGNVRIVFNEKGDIVQNTEYYPFGLAIAKDGKTLAERNSINRFLYNEKELQVGSGYLDYGARMYMPEVGRWGAVDPMSEKREWLSPYNYVQNNPVMRVDPDGAFDDFVFNQMGKFVRIDRNDRPDKLIVENSQTGVKQKYDFADPVADPRAIRDGTINQVVFVRQSEIQRMLEQQGAFDPSNGVLNFYQESKGGGDFDYSYSVIPGKFPGASADPIDKSNPSPMLFLPEGESTVHNHMNFGNYLWAATGYTIGFNYATLQFAAHGNSVVDPGRANGYAPQLDSRDDQRSIVKGAYHAQRNQYRQILKQRKK